jgi:hypothetical protein
LIYFIKVDICLFHSLAYLGIYTHVPAKNIEQGIV